MPDCYSCKVPMIWTISPNNKRLPLDARPVEVLKRNSEIAPTLGTMTRYRTEDRGGELHAVQDDEGAYVSHFVTCVSRDQHRKPR